MHALHSFYRRIRLMSKQTKGMAKPPIETKKENLMADGRVQEFLYYNVICIRLLTEAGKCQVRNIFYLAAAT